MIFIGGDKKVAVVVMLWSLKSIKTVSAKVTDEQLLKFWSMACYQRLNLKKKNSLKEVFFNNDDCPRLHDQITNLSGSDWTFLMSRVLVRQADTKIISTTLYNTVWNIHIVNVCLHIGWHLLKLKFSPRLMLVCTWLICWIRLTRLCWICTSEQLLNTHRYSTASTLV